MARNRKRKGAGGGARSRAGSLSWLLVVVAVALVATVVLAVRRRSAVRQAAMAPAVSSTFPAQGPVAVPASVMEDLVNIPADTWNRAGISGAATPALIGESRAEGGKPVVLYVGAGFCPYCAAARWSMIASLSRFGTFSGLTLAASSSVDVFPNTPTFSFYGSSYTSEHIELQTVEVASEVLMANGRYQPLETPTAAQEALLEKYDNPPYVDPAGAGGIPFILAGERYMWGGSPFSPALLAGQSQAAIAATLPAGSGPAAQAILANANVFTAVICALDGNEPADVCSDSAVRRALEALPGQAR